MATDAIAQPAEVEGCEPEKPKRKRSTKRDVKNKTMAAIAYKIQRPEWTHVECAEKVGMPESTLRHRDEWNEWAPRIDNAQAIGKMGEVRAKFDKRIGEMVAYRDDEERSVNA